MRHEPRAAVARPGDVDRVQVPLADIQNPDGIAGTTYRKRMSAMRARAAAAAASASGGELDGGTVAAEPQLVGES